MSIHVLALATNATQDWYNELGKTAILNLQNLAIIYFLSFLQLSSNVDSSRSAYFLIIVLRALIAKKKKKIDLLSENRSHSIHAHVKLFSVN